jgi:hypothetical protein
MIKYPKIKIKMILYKISKKILKKILNKFNNQLKKINLIKNKTKKIKKLMIQIYNLRIKILKL